MVGDFTGECVHPQAPSNPYTDKKIAILITKQSQAIDACRALIGS